MATKTLGPQPGWLVGETIEVFEVDARGVAVGNAVGSATVAGDSTTTFSALESDKRYLAADANGIKVWFGTLTDPDEGGGSLPPGGTSGQVLAKASDTDGDAQWVTGGDVPSDASPTAKGIVQLAGDLTGTAAAPQIAAGAIVNADINAAAAIAESKLNLAADAAAGTASRRTLGSGSTQAAPGDHSHTALTVQAPATPSVRALGTTSTTACAGDDARLSNTRTPTDNTVSTAKIQNGAVTAAKVASDVATQAELDTHATDTTAVHGIVDTTLIPGIARFSGGVWPARPFFPIVFWIGGGVGDQPPAMIVDDVWIRKA